MNDRIRNRFPYLATLAVVIAAGLVSRAGICTSFPFFAAYAGDTLWTIATYLCLRLLFFRLRPSAIGASALGISFLVEISQMYHAPWIDFLRSTWVGGKLLGYGFLWSDLACYATGAFMGFLIDSWFISSKNNRKLHT
jgi:hypothetical protein